MYLHSFALVFLSAVSYLLPALAGSAPHSRACQALLKDHPLASVKPALKHAGVIKDVLPKSFKPSFVLDIVYANKIDGVLGDNISLNDTISEPKLIACPVGNYKPSKTYTLAMVDPDAPSRATPTYREVRHWLVTGLRLPSFRSHSPYIIQTEQPVTPYINPQPGVGSGPHRYVAVLLEELSPNFTVPLGAPEYNTTIPGRLNWNLLQFAKKYNLDPVGAAFFVTNAD